MLQVQVLNTGVFLLGSQVCVSMRVPHTIPHNTSLVYQSSEQTQNLPGEVNRTLRAEDVTWDKTIPSTLATLCVQSLAFHFKGNVYMYCRIANLMPVGTSVHLEWFLGACENFKIITISNYLFADDMLIFSYEHNLWPVPGSMKCLDCMSD